MSIMHGKITGGLKSHDMSAPEVVLTGDDGPRLVRYFLHADIPDDQDEWLPIDMAEIAIDRHINGDRQGAMIDSHTNKIRARLLKQWREVHPRLNVPAIRGEIRVFDEYQGDDRFWNDIKAGVYGGTSWGGDATKIRDHCMDDACSMVVGRYVEPPEIYEYSFVHKPSNPGADMPEVAKVKGLSLCRIHEIIEQRRKADYLTERGDRYKGEAGELSTVLSGVIHEAYTAWADRLTQEGSLNTEDRILIGGAIGDLLGRIEAVLPERLAKFPLVTNPHAISHTFTPPPGRGEDETVSPMKVYTTKAGAADLEGIPGILAIVIPEPPPLVVHVPRNRLDEVARIKGIDVVPFTPPPTEAELLDLEWKRERLRLARSYTTEEEPSAH